IGAGNLCNGSSAIPYTLSPPGAHPGELEAFGFRKHPVSVNPIGVNEQVSSTLRAAEPPREAAETVQSLLLREHRHVLELVARGERPLRCLEELCLAIERVDPSVRVCIVLVGSDGRHFSRIVASRLTRFAEALRALPESGDPASLCAPAVVTTPRAFRDVAADAHWPGPWKALFRAHSINALHVAPVRERGARPQGGVFLCLEASRKPEIWDRMLADMASSVCAIILAREESDEALASSRLALAAELELARHLQALSTWLIQADDADSLPERILDTAVAIMQSDFASMQMVEPETGELRLLAQRGFPPESVRFWQRVRPSSHSSCGMALKTGRRCLVPDLEECDFVAGSTELEVHREAGMRAMQSTPLYSRSGTMIGMISTHWRRPHTPAEREFRAFDVLARQAADLIERLAAEAALRESNRRKDEFLATLAHELRNPIAPLRNALELMKVKNANREAAPECLAMMERQVEHITRLVDDLLDVSRVSRGIVELRKEPLEVGSVVNDAVEAVRPVCDARGHLLTVSLPSRPIWVHGDRTRLAQVLQNLLHNACKFTPSGGCIWIGARCEGEEAVFSVRDNGSGIQPEHLPHLFDMFVQADDTRSRSGAGLGIGLTLVKNLVALHGGTVRAHSEGAGRGSEFTVRLPLAPEPATAPSAKPEGHAPGVVPRRILVVDDNQDAADSLAQLLSLRGHDVHTAYDGHAAIAAAAELEPDAVLLDIGLPGLDGHEVARQIRERRPEPRPLLVALTGWGQETDRRDSAAAGFDHHLVKPVDLGVVEELLAALPG